MHSERNHPRRRGGHAPVSGDERGEQAASARLRQADDLLPVERSDAGGDPGHPGHHRAAARLGLPAAAGRRQSVGPRVAPCDPAKPRRAGPGIPDRRGVHRRRRLRTCTRRQHLPRTGTDREAAQRRLPAQGRDGLRLSGPRPRALWRGVVRRDRPRHVHRGEAEAPAFALGGDRSLLLRQRRRANCLGDCSERARRAGDHGRQRALPSTG